MLSDKIKHSQLPEASEATIYGYKYALQHFNRFLRSESSDRIINHETASAKHLDIGEGCCDVYLFQRFSIYYYCKVLVRVMVIR